MIARYETVWPALRFTFHVPYQRLVPRGARVSPRRTGGAIRATVLELLEEFDDETWVYWCLDDKYPVRLVEAPVARLAEAVLDDGLPGVDGVLFCRCRRLLEPEYLLDERREAPGGVTLLRRKDYSQIWIHQFLRVKVLRRLFRELPASVPRPGDLDPLKDRIPLPADHRLYVVETNLAVFGESTVGGRVTRNCAASLRALGRGLPRGFQESEDEILMGAIATPS
jgi:hypothetical protein